MTFKPHIRFVWCLGVLALFSLAFIPATLAVDPPAISVNPTWRPATQLSTLDSGAVGVTNPGDDLRYVDADIYATTSVQFWAVDITCTVDKTVLETYTVNTDTGGGPAGNGISSPDDVQPVTYSTDWSLNGSFLQNVVNTVNTDGKINFVATRVGLSSPMGSNGTKTTLLLATLRYRTKVLAANKTSALTCTAAFLDKNGKSVLVPTVVAPAPLSVITGYTIKGKVVYQDQIAQTGIVVNCIDSANGDHFGTPTAAGDFTVATRDLGTHDCYFYGSKINANTTTEDSHLTARTSFKLNSAIYNLLPVTLRSGNTNRDGGYVINLSDFSIITSNWNTVKPAFTNGDANGDTKVDKTDLALVSGNFVGSGLMESVNASHFIYSLPRDNEKFMNSHVWIGGYYGDASVSQFVPGTDRNYWATLSPDGSRIAFTRNIGTGSADKFALFVAPVTAGVVGAAVNITPSAPFDAFAPSWSPDGTTLAFSCAYSRTDWTFGKGRANLCLVGADGKNLRQKISLPASNQMINIFPVAWFNNTSLMYGSPDWFDVLNPLPSCNNRICRLVMDSTNPNVYNIPENSIAVSSDMPVIRRGPLGAVVFYRISLGVADDVIRFAELNDVASGPAVMGTYNCAAAANSGLEHCEIATGVGYDQIGYLNAYTGNNDNDLNVYGIVFYSQDENTADGGGVNYSIMDWNGSVSAPSWTKNYSTYSVANVVGNPAITIPNTPNYPNPEGFLALRNTIEWVP